jgi:hypothetical protein
LRNDNVVVGSLPFLGVSSLDLGRTEVRPLFLAA